MLWQHWKKWIHPELQENDRRRAPLYPRTEVQSSMGRSQLWIAGWKHSHCDASRWNSLHICLLGYRRKGKPCIGGNLLEAFYRQTCQEGCWGKLPGAESCWVLCTGGTGCMGKLATWQELRTGEAAVLPDLGAGNTRHVSLLPSKHDAAGKDSPFLLKCFFHAFHWQSLTWCQVAKSIFP